MSACGSGDVPACGVGDAPADAAVEMAPVDADLGEVLDTLVAMALADAAGADSDTNDTSHEAAAHDGETCQASGHDGEPPRKKRKRKKRSGAVRLSRAIDSHMSNAAKAKQMGCNMVAELSSQTSDRMAAKKTDAYHRDSIARKKTGLATKTGGPSHKLHILQTCRFL